MIKAILLDVDGVIIGEKIGYNSPHPHPDVIAVLKKIREKGIAVCLCTAKPHYSIAEEIKAPNLHNPHIADAGAVIIDPIDKIIVENMCWIMAWSKRFFKHFGMPAYTWSFIQLMIILSNYAVTAQRLQTAQMN